MKHSFNGDSRSNQRAKRRKTNLILNSLIAIVVLLIIIVSISIFWGGGEKASSSQDDSTQTENKDKGQKDSSTNNEEDDSENESNVEDSDDESTSTGESETETVSGTDSESSDDTSNTEDESLDDSEYEDIVTEGGNDPNVKTTITNPNWKPVGTTQSGEHNTVYDSESTDWQEMIQAMTYATGLDPSNTTVWFLGRNNPSGSQSIATISTKDQSQIYRVIIEWVDGQGWKPLKVEELLQNDRR
ncbi:DUF1510 family protein [Bacillus sp. CGMCC 1.16607]|uniref:YrrS family protein n=1 Tax=Bacillus sp. CGMCC 1.16607 TaxID=3351842 RepID=UPI00362B52AB